MSNSSGINVRRFSSSSKSSNDIFNMDEDEGDLNDLNDVSISHATDNTNVVPKKLDGTDKSLFPTTSSSSSSDTSQYYALMPELSESAYSDDDTEHLADLSKPVLDAKYLFCLLKDRFFSSRCQRLVWFLDLIERRLVFPAMDVPSTYTWGQRVKYAQKLSGIDIVTVLPHANDCNVESLDKYQYRVTPETIPVFFPETINYAIVLDLSPCTLRIPNNGKHHYGFIELIYKLNDLLECLNKPIQFSSSLLSLKPCVHVTVIAHTPFFTVPAQQVIVHGVKLNAQSIIDIIGITGQFFTMMQTKIAEVVHRTEVHHLRARVSIVNGDANFVNMIRYAMTALSTRDVYGCAMNEIIIITDGVLGVPDSNIQDTLLNQLRLDSTRLSFYIEEEQDMSKYGYSYVPSFNLLELFAKATGGTVLKCNVRQKASTKERKPRGYPMFSSFMGNPSYSWCPPLHRYEQFTRMQCTSICNTEILDIAPKILLSVRMKDGFFISKIKTTSKFDLEIVMFLPWAEDITIEVKCVCPKKAVTQNPFNQVFLAKIQYAITFYAPKQMIRDFLPSRRANFRASYRQARADRVLAYIEYLMDFRFMLSLSYYFNASVPTVQIPPSALLKLPVFTSNYNEHFAFKRQPNFTHELNTLFINFWAEFLNSDLAKFFHVHKIRFILSHQEPVPQRTKTLNRLSTLVQCRQSMMAFFNNLVQWSSFVLVDNQTYVRIIRDKTSVISFVVVNVLTKSLPFCLMILNFMTATPTKIRNVIINEMTTMLRNLTYDMRPHSDDFPEKIPIDHKPNAATVLTCPMETMLIRYTKCPGNPRNITFPDGHEPVMVETEQGGAEQENSTPVSFMTSLARFHYHQRRYYNVSLSNACMVDNISMSRILDTLCKMRLKEGFVFGYSALGILNMCKEVVMTKTNKYGCTDMNAKCLIQYIIFPVVKKNKRLLRFEASVKKSDDEMTTPNDTSTTTKHEYTEEAYLMTEVWIVPQYGYATNIRGPDGWYMDDLSYLEIDQAIAEKDMKCISSILTLEHLSFLCTAANRKINIVELGMGTLPMKKSDVSISSECISGIPQSLYSNFVPDSIYRRIMQVPFTFNFLNILPKCQLAELAFSMMEEGPWTAIHEDTTPNNTFYNHLLREVRKFHDRELIVPDTNVKRFFHLLMAREVNVQGELLSPLQWCDRLFSSSGVKSLLYPRWRCFLRGIANSHVLLTFVPYSIQDVRVLTTPTLFHNRDEMDSKMYAARLKSDNKPRPIRLIATNRPVLPILVYNCPLNPLMISFIDDEFHELQRLNDIYCDRRFPSISVRSDRHFSIENYKLTNVPKDNFFLQQCNAYSLAHAKHFVSAVARAVRDNSNVSHEDLHSAVRLCHRGTISFDINQYIHAVCGHLTRDAPNRSCDLRRPFHRLIRNAFTERLTDYFVMTPHGFFVCSDTQNAFTMSQGPIKQWEIDDLSKEDLALLSPPMPLNSENIEDHADDFTPPFLLFIETSVNNLPAQLLYNLPTCIMQMTDDAQSLSDLNSLEVKQPLLMVRYATLPRTVQNIDVFYPTVEENPSDDEVLSMASPTQKHAVSTLDQRVTWQLNDEHVTALLDDTEITGSTLQNVVNHILNSAESPQTKIDFFPLHFVTDDTLCLQKFLEDMKSITVCEYRVAHNDDFFFLVKNDTNDDITMDSSFEKIANDANGLDCDVRVNYPVDDDYLEGDYKWLMGIEKGRKLMPNFWLIFEVENFTVKFYYHFGYMRLNTAYNERYKEIFLAARTAVTNLWKRVNQFFLLKFLHDARACDRLLESPGEYARDFYTGLPLDLDRPYCGRPAVLYQMDQLDATPSAQISHSNSYLEILKRHSDGSFSCPIVWEVHFKLHERLKTTEYNKTSYHRGIQAICSVLNKFAVYDRNNMFVYKDKQGNVFYFRLYENINNVVVPLETWAAMRGWRATDRNFGESSNLHRTQSAASLPEAQPAKQKELTITGQIVTPSSSIDDTRPRVRSFGEKDVATNVRDKGNFLNGTITLRVHGISNVASDITQDLVQVLTNRLDDAVLEILCMTLQRNPNCILMPEDVHFLQKPASPPNVVFKVPIHPKAQPFQSELGYYIKQNLSLFLSTPKYASIDDRNHFFEYVNSGVRRRDNFVFLYNQTLNSANKGIACISMAMICNKEAYNASANSTTQKFTFEEILNARTFSPEGTDHVLHVEFAIWSKGNVNIDSLKKQLRRGVHQGIWDLVMEFQILVEPLCVSRTDTSRGSISSDERRWTGWKNSKSTTLNANFTKIFLQWMHFGQTHDIPAAREGIYEIANMHSVKDAFVEIKKMIHARVPGTKTWYFFKRENQREYTLQREEDEQRTCDGIIVVHRNFDDLTAQCEERRFMLTTQRFLPGVEMHAVRRRIAFIQILPNRLMVQCYNWSKDYAQELLNYMDGRARLFNMRVLVMNSIVRQTLGVFRDSNTLKSEWNRAATSLAEAQQISRRLVPTNDTIAASMRDYINNASKLGKLQPLLNVTMSKLGARAVDVSTSDDPVIKLTNSVKLIEQVNRAEEDKEKIVRAIWTKTEDTFKRLVSDEALKKLVRSSRILCQVQCPFAFSSKWRFTKLSGAIAPFTNDFDDKGDLKAHLEACMTFYNDYRRFALQSFSFTPLRHSDTSIMQEASSFSERVIHLLSNGVYLAKSVYGGLLIMELTFIEPYVSLRLCAIEMNPEHTPTMPPHDNFLDVCNRVNNELIFGAHVWDFHVSHIYTHIVDGLVRAQDFAVNYNVAEFLNELVLLYPWVPCNATRYIYRNTVCVDLVGVTADDFIQYLIAYHAKYGLRMLRQKLKSPYSATFSLEWDALPKDFSPIETRALAQYHILCLITCIDAVQLTMPNKFNCCYFVILVPKSEINAASRESHVLLADFDYCEDLSDNEATDAASTLNLEDITETKSSDAVPTITTNKLKSIVADNAFSVHASIKHVLDHMVIKCRQNILWKEVIFDEPSGATCADFLGLLRVSHSTHLHTLEPELFALLNKRRASFYKWIPGRLKRHFPSLKVYGAHNDQLRYHVISDTSIEDFFLLLIVSTTGRLESVRVVLRDSSCDVKSDLPSYQLIQKFVEAWSYEYFNHWISTL